MQMRVSPPLAALVLLLLVAPASGRALEQEGVDPALTSRLRRIESAFRDGDAVSLRLSFSAAARVRVDLQDLAGGQGSYGSGQLQVIFGHIFDQYRTQDFAFGADGVRIPGPGTAFARSRWVRRGQPPGTDTVDMLTFTLRQERGDWRILEIRSSR